MRNCSPKSVLSYLCVYAEHQSSRVREEVTHFLIIFPKKLLSSYKTKQIKRENIVKNSKKFENNQISYAIN